MFTQKLSRILNQKKEPIKIISISRKIKTQLQQTVALSFSSSIWILLEKLIQVLKYKESFRA